MSALDYIKIQGLDGEYVEDVGNNFEVFQGISAAFATDGTTTAGTLTITPISSDPDLADLIWEGQNEKLESENAYCDQLQKLFEKKQTRVEGIWDKLLDVVEEFIGGLLSKFVMGIVLYNTGSLELTWLSGFLTELGVEWGLDALVSLLKRGNELLNGIKAENDKLLQLEKSRENYEYREQVLARHREDIKVILEQIRLAEKQVEINAQLEMNALLERLTDIAFRDVSFETGDMKIHHRGKVVEF